MSTSTNLHTAWAELVVHALASTGVRDLVVSPGSRSTPLALAAAREPTMRIHVHVDERVAGFFALGHARATGNPVALMCTSGTAGAHWIPAAIEADLAAIPLLCITADRPWEAYDCASPQTIDQVDLLGRAARHNAELGTPTATPEALRAVGRMVAQCVAFARGPVPGPVHLNARFRKPLEPVEAPEPEPWNHLVSELLARPVTQLYEPWLRPSPEAIAQIADAVRNAHRGWVVCGPTMTHGAAALARDRAAIRALCHTTSFALLAETTSGVRVVDDSVTTLAAFDSMLRSSTFEERARPDVILEFGLPPTSTAYAQWISAHPDVPRYVIAPYHWPDPHANAVAIVRSTASAFAESLLAAPGLREASSTRATWSHAMRNDAANVRRVLMHITHDPALTEATVPAVIIRLLPEGAVLCVGNSLCARDIDAFTDDRTVPLQVLHQRGASGIDGLIAGAAGARTATPDDVPVLVYLGDLSLVHDLAALNAARHARAPLVIVVVQNGGGRIFEQLPLGRRARRDAALAETFERLFVTPQTVSFEHAAATFGVRYHRVTTRKSFERRLGDALRTPMATLIEAAVTHEGLALRDAAHAAVQKALDHDAQGAA